MTSNYYNSYSPVRGFAFGVMAGIVAAVIVFLVGRVISPMLPPVGHVGSPFSFDSYLRAVFGNPSGYAIYFALAARVMIGIIVGGSFGLIVSSVQGLRVTSTAKGIGLGLVAGIITWIAFSVLGVIGFDFLFTQTPGLSVIGFYLMTSLTRYIAFGLIMGAIVGALLLKHGVSRKSMAAPMAQQTPKPPRPQ